MTKPKAQVTGCDLKKRTQFPAGKVNVKSFEKRGYEKKTRRGLRANERSGKKRKIAWGTCSLTG